MARSAIKVQFGSTSRRITGADAVVRNFNREANAIKGRTLKGLIKVQAQIRSDMDHFPPKIPVKTGDMRRSYFCVTSNGAIISGRTPGFRSRVSDRLAAEHAAVVNEQIMDQTSKKSRGPSISFGFTAYYMPIVHENYEADNWTRPGSGPGFFVAAIYRNRIKGLQIIAKEARIR